MNVTLYVPEDLLDRARAARLPLSRTFRYALEEVLAAAEGEVPAGTLAAKVLPLVPPGGRASPSVSAP